MKIGYLGGVKNGQNRIILSGYDKSELNWETQVESRSLVSQVPNFQSSLSLPTKEFDTYKLMIFTKENEKKFFYIEESLTRVQIQPLIEEFWGISDTIGYEF